ncbi:MAG: glycosyltransferase [Varibaculum sp.]|nr:glycosyltransferase [Varibaculum sp.]
MKLRMYRGDDVPENEIASFLSDALMECDRAWESGKDALVAKLLATMLDIIFAPKRIQVTDPDSLSGDSLMELLNESRAYRQITEHQQRIHTARLGGPGRLLILHPHNDTFIKIHAEELEQTGWKITWLDTKTDSWFAAHANTRTIVRLAIMNSRGNAPRVPSHVANLIADADAIWIEWGLAQAALLSQYRLNKPTVIRIHRYEAQTQWPLLFNTAGFDSITYVSDWVRRVAQMHRPELAEMPSQVISLGVDSRCFTTDKTPAAVRTLALVGWNRPVKDPDFALAILDRLLEKDPSWRLLLVGDEPDTNTEWGRRLVKRVGSHGESVENLGFRRDIPEVLKRVGYILSTSRLESFHSAVIEGAVTGCVPVVRNWPDVKHLGGAASIYPKEWIVETPEEAAARILTNQPPSEKARVFVTETLALNRINHQIEDLFYRKNLEGHHR